MDVQTPFDVFPICGEWFLKNESGWNWRLRGAVDAGPRRYRVKKMGLAAKKRKKRKIKDRHPVCRFSIHSEEELPMRRWVGLTLCFCASCAFLRLFSMRFLG
jgi:hypothetical protein